MTIFRNILAGVGLAAAAVSVEAKASPSQWSPRTGLATGAAAAGEAGAPLSVAPEATIDTAHTLAPGVATDLTGDWIFSVVTENGTGTPAVVLKQTGDSLSGTYESARMGTLLLRGAVEGRKFSFAVLTDGGTTLTFSGAIEDDDNLKGEVYYDDTPGASFTATRKKGGK